MMKALGLPTPSFRGSFLGLLVRLGVPLLLLSFAKEHQVHASVSCIWDADCEAGLDFQGSKCIEGKCQNPFYKGGCLYNMLEGWDKLRVCHSDDPPDAEEQGYCRKSPMDYMEVRIHSQGWESAFFGSWILQILLSEMLDVPVSIEATAGMNDDLYDPQLRLDYPTFDISGSGIKNAEEFGGDCRKASRDPNNYELCYHVMPETWAEGDNERLHLLEEDLVEPPREIGAMAEQYIFIPKFVAEMDPTLVSYVGLQGEKNRRKMAETFKTPTTWKYYCDSISTTKCSVKDDVASRPPREDEEDFMFLENSYTGFFRNTTENDCDENPETCHGHIADYECTWAAFVPMQFHHLDISLESKGSDVVGGYSYSQLVQIWHAANHTRSPVMMMWFQPEALYQSFIGTDAEFMHVLLPTQTQECVDARLEYDGRCSEDPVDRQGPAEGACDNAPQSLKKYISKQVKALGQDPDIPEAMWSPAHDALQNYRLTHLHIGSMLSAWLDRAHDTDGFDPRFATCEWVVDNLDIVKSFIPDTYPRVVKHEETDETALFRATHILSILVAALVFVSLFVSFLKRKTKTLYYLRPEFMYVVHVGLIMVAVSGTLLTGVTDEATCVSSVWMSSLGYCWILIPLLTRMDAINKLFATGKQMQRIRVGKYKFLLSVLGTSAVVATFLLLWTLMDTPSVRDEFEVAASPNANGETMVAVSTYCGSDAAVWSNVNVAWQLLVAFFASVLAFMASRVREDINDTRMLSLVIIVHLLFAILRLVMLILGSSVDDVDRMAYTSLLMSLECLSALVVFIVPTLAMSGSEMSEDEDKTTNLPDLYLRTTILYADIAGFAAWSSVRDPQQVFKFLEAIYGAFDNIGEKRNVFKVETIGDTYVAATGIPNQRKDHAIAMARYSMDLMSLMRDMTKELEVVYGPDTGNLSLRIGLHSGPITGGFLKGKGARFQLFGETAQIARQICASSEKGTIHVSEATADLLTAEKKDHWLTKRENLTPIKGHGDMPLYRLGRNGGALTTNSSGASISDFEAIQHDLGESAAEDDELHNIEKLESSAEQKQRLINWNVEVLHQILKQICARRLAQSGKMTASSKDAIGSGSLHDSSPDVSMSVVSSTIENNSNHIYDTPLDEVKEIITLPAFDQKVAKRQKDAADIEVPEAALDQLKIFVTAIAGLYRDNPFHSFAHASHVVMSTIKHMNRIVAPTNLEMVDEENYVKHKAAAALHDHTYGITSDPLTQFACVFSALIHDVDHPGVPNPQLIEEDPMLAALYKNRSVAEQNSFSLAWELLMQVDMYDLRMAICGEKNGLKRFRQLVINSVMATDLGDKELKALRNGRWEKAFSPKEAAVDSSNEVEDINRKATIVIEHLIQASDVSHTMQHWEIYREWNEKLFEEMYDAFREGRASKNPADFWFDGEIGFFDFYIIPLSKKLNDCGVFGLSSDENLNYATRNRELWVSLGKMVTAEMLQKCEAKWEKKAKNTNSVSTSAETGPEAFEEETLPVPVEDEA